MKKKGNFRKVVSGLLAGMTMLSTCLLYTSQIQKQQIKWDYAKAKRSEQTVGTATKGTIDYIKKIGGRSPTSLKKIGRCISV